MNSNDNDYISEPMEIENKDLFLKEEHNPVFFTCHNPNCKNTDANEFYHSSTGVVCKKCWNELFSVEPSPNFKF